jgi:hypothetical protein
MKIKYVKYTKDFTKSFIQAENVIPKNAIIGLFSKKNKKAFEMMLVKRLMGQTVKAFGPKGKGYWGTNKKILTYTINDVVIEEGSKNYDNFRIYLEKYDTMKKYGFIYTDKTFETDIKKLTKGLGEIDYTEQGMQGRNYVSMTIDYW